MALVGKHEAGQVGATIQQNVDFIRIGCRHGQLQRYPALLVTGVDLHLPINSRPLHYALSSGNGHLFELLLRGFASIDPNLADDEGATPLHLICSRPVDDYDDGTAESFFEICDATRRKVDVDARDSEGNSPLLLALRRNRRKLAELLLSRAADPTLANDEGTKPLDLVTKGTPLYLALENDCPTMAELLLRHGADPNLANDDGDAPLHLMCKHKDRIEDEFVRLFFWINELNTRTLAVDARNRWSRTPLHLALANEHRTMAELLIRHGADPNLADGRDGLAPLHLMCCEHEYEADFIQLFFDICEARGHAVLIDAEDKLGRTALQLALENVKPNMVDVLVNRGADLAGFALVDPNWVNGEGATPLHLICSRPKDDGTADTFFEILDELNRSVEIDARDNEGGNTPLHLAARNGHAQLVELLLRRGADPNLANDFGSTPLHFICSRAKNDELVDTLFGKLDELLTTKFLEVDAQDASGNSPLHLALKRGNEHLMELLLEHGADANLSNLNGTTPLHVIAKRGHDADKLAASFVASCDEAEEPVLVDTRDKRGRTALHLALERGHAGMARLLLENGAEANEPWPADGWRPLHVVARSRHYNADALLELLLENGADPNAATPKEGWTPLHIMTQRADDGFMLKRFFLINHALEQLVLVDAWDNEGNAPLHLALKQRRKTVAEWLLRFSTDPNLEDRDGLAPLHLMCKYGYEAKFVRLFFEICKDSDRYVLIDAKDKLGRTPLQWAVASLSLISLEILVDNGADISDNGGGAFPAKAQFDECSAIFLEQRQPPSSSSSSKTIGKELRSRVRSSALDLVQCIEQRVTASDLDGATDVVELLADLGLYEENPAEDWDFESDAEPLACRFLETYFATTADYGGGLMRLRKECSDAIVARIGAILLERFHNPFLSVVPRRDLERLPREWLAVTYGEHVLRLVKSDDDSNVD
ncbi:unnamed protein product [Trichogramma brassicae]|uniref:Uncharacterized protein n=1 Tax=Trichogramma brassicae TaxID=86971 RepID=A0A6H5J822_9HYME|nr:unnamed protein product [Trichogramma brassicae]